MKKRRYSLTQEQADTLIFALEVTLHSFESLKEYQQKEPYIQWKKSQLETVLYQLKTYRWEI